MDATKARRAAHALHVNLQCFLLLMLGGLGFLWAAPELWSTDEAQQPWGERGLVVAIGVGCVYVANLLTYCGRLRKALRST